LATRWDGEQDSVWAVAQGWMRADLQQPAAAAF
jgi:hypothetical protein